MKRNMATVLILILALLCGCSVSAGEGVSEGPAQIGEYKLISQEEALLMMNEDALILDVREEDEYDSGHIPGAIRISAVDVAILAPDVILDKEQVILIYCKSGKRSEAAARALCDAGYVNVYDFGGILSWEGEIVQ